MICLLSGVLLAEDLGYGVHWLVNIFIIAIVITTGFIIYIACTTKNRYKNKKSDEKEDIKYKLYKYHAERYWAIFVAGILIWFWVIGYPWSPPVAFEKALSNNSKVHIINVTAGQWFWQFSDEGIRDDESYTKSDYNNAKSISVNKSNIVNPINKINENHTDSTSNPLKIKVGETVKFVAHSIDVNHGFGVLKSSKSMDSPLMQMQVVPGYDNVFYYTFKNPGTYTIRCLEYCGWNHPYMVSQITVVTSSST
jgi:heme/copper-type cytochrome/quinol oxidase subunit 2